MNGITRCFFDGDDGLRGEAVPPLAPPGWLEKANLRPGLEIRVSAMPTMGLLTGCRRSSRRRRRRRS